MITERNHIWQGTPAQIAAKTRDALQQDTLVYRTAAQPLPGHPGEVFVIARLRVRPQPPRRQSRRLAAAGAVVLLIAAAVALIWFVAVPAVTHAATSTASSIGAIRISHELAEFLGTLAATFAAVLFLRSLFPR
jgi:hypothetical protein